MIEPEWSASAIIGHTSEAWGEIEEQCGSGIEAEFEENIKKEKKKEDKAEAEFEAGSAQSMTSNNLLRKWPQGKTVSVGVWTEYGQTLY